jgi:glyceraldehyde 3-phosphate dehydrogenase
MGALGRASLPNLIPKPTTAVPATERVMPEIAGKLLGFSYRTPTAIVTSANLTLTLRSPITAAEINDAFQDAVVGQAWNVFEYCVEPLVSMDYCGNRASSIIDGRWTEVIGGTHVRLVLWYDNEYGYSSRVCDLVPFLMGASA